MKASDIVKPSNLGDFLRLQISCLQDGVEKLQFLACFDHRQDYLPGNPVVELLAIYEIAQTPAIEISFLVIDNIDQALRLFEQVLSGKEIAQTLGVAWVQLKQGLGLEPVCIPKPWGQEIWYTGIEQRGVSRVKSEEGTSPLDWILAAAPGYLLGEHKTPVLLKILDPLADEVYGDLYFEMHEKKQEVYIVTHVDERAWPNGKGGIRFGFNQSLRSTFASDQDFKQAYLQAVQDYRQVRQQIDSLLDEKRYAEQIGLNDPLMPQQLLPWLQTLPPDLLQQEKVLRQRMENFIAIKALVVGDVVKVPCYTPHSLQHGVRTVEFQTPVYERKILSFAQKVLTQGHWDTEAALPQLELDAPAETPLLLLEANERVTRQQAVQFDDFAVQRITLQPHARYDLSSGSYRLLMLLAGELALNDKILQREQACLLAQVSSAILHSGQDGAVFLLAEPAQVTAT